MLEGQINHWHGLRRAGYPMQVRRCRSVAAVRTIDCLSKDERRTLLERGVPASDHPRNGWLSLTKSEREGLCSGRKLLGQRRAHSLCNEYPRFRRVLEHELWGALDAEADAIRLGRLFVGLGGEVRIHQLANNFQLDRANINFRNDPIDFLNDLALLISHLRLCDFRRDQAGESTASQMLLYTVCCITALRWFKFCGRDILTTIGSALLDRRTIDGYQFNFTTEFADAWLVWIDTQCTTLKQTAGDGGYVGDEELPQASLLSCIHPFARLLATPGHDARDRLLLLLHRSALRLDSGAPLRTLLNGRGLYQSR